MLHHLAATTIQVANLVNYNSHPQEGGKNEFLFHPSFFVQENKSD